MQWISSPLCYLYRVLSIAQVATMREYRSSCAAENHRASVIGGDREDGEQQKRNTKSLKGA